MAENKIAIELSEITKTFGEVVANKNACLSVKHGEIHALSGENGSGKTTLMSVLLGIYSPDKGTICINGEQVSIKGPIDSKRLGIGMVHQHSKLIDNFSAAENMLIGLTNDKNYDDIEKFCIEYGFDINLKKKIYDMSVSEKQMVEIIRVLYHGAKILIFDEPTAVLTEQETQKLFSILRKLKEKDYAIIIISHKLNEVLDNSDSITVMRKGETIGTVKAKGTTVQELADMMVGQAVELSIARPVVESQGPLLEVKDVSISEAGTKIIQNVSFNLNSGEILGVAGVSCGQEKLCEAIAGLLDIESGSIEYKEINIVGMSPRKMKKCGINMAFIPEDGLKMGLVSSFGCGENMALKNYYEGRGPLLNLKEAIVQAKAVIEKYGIVTPGLKTEVRKLSGGNQQKLLLGRELQNNPQIVIMAYPVRGLDIGSAYEVYDEINELKLAGVGIIYVGEDIDSMLQFCDRIMVLCNGKVTGILNTNETNKGEIGLLMTDSLSKSENKGAASENNTDEKRPKSKIIRYH